MTALHNIARALLQAVIVIVSIGATMTSTACSYGVETTLPEAPLPVRALTIIDDGQIYTPADDEDLSLTGLQVSVKVAVYDEAIDEVQMYNRIDGKALKEPVREDLEGYRHATFLVTLPAIETAVLATAPNVVLTDDSTPVEAEAVLRSVW